MEQNIGLTDRYVRITLGGLLLAASAARLARRGAGAGGMAVGLLGGMMLAEGVLGNCPLYRLLGINTNSDGHHCCDSQCECADHQNNEPDATETDVMEPYDGI